MLIRGTVRLLPFISLSLVIFFAIARYKRHALLKSWSLEYGQWAKEVVVPLKISTEVPTKQSPSPGPAQTWNRNPTDSNEDGIDLTKITLPLPEQDPYVSTISNTHNEIFSLSTSSGEYFPIFFGEHETLNPNIIPHPSSESKWIIVAQQKTQDDVPAYSRISVQLVCDAVFRPSNDNNHDNNPLIDAGGNNGNGKSLTCVTTPTVLPIAATSSENRCQGRWEALSLNVGPHDARLFYGPEVPYVIYGSNSRYTCFGQWIQNFRMLFNWSPPLNEEVAGIDESDNSFRTPTELYRPAPYGQVEKNWFIFWDTNGDAYVHYDVWPQRSFAKIQSQSKSLLPGEDLTDSSIVGPDLAILSSAADASCMNKYMPEIRDFDNEFIHQATNSLSITLCKRSELNCQPSDFNTFIFTIFQKKVHVGVAGSSYEPYVMLFRRNAPFELHGISTKPFWIHGRKPPQQEAGVREMMYVTSMSWINHSQKYHGYSDDTLFLAFGIDDSRTAGIDVQAGDFLKDMGICVNN